MLQKNGENHDNRKEILDKTIGENFNLVSTSGVVSGAKCRVAIRHGIPVSNFFERSC